MDDKLKKFYDYELGLNEYIIEEKDNKIVLKVDYSDFIARYDLIIKLNKICNKKIEIKKEKWDIEKILENLVKEI